MSGDKSNSMCSLRIYLKRGENKVGRTFWERLFEKPLSHYLVTTALKSGINFGSVQFGNIGFVQGAKNVSFNGAEVSPETLPVCIELMATRGVLDGFINEQKAYLKGKVVLLFESSQEFINA